MKKWFLVVVIVVFLALIFKPAKVAINIIFPENLNGVNYITYIDEKIYEKNEVWLFPGNHNILIKVGKNKINRELYVPYFLFSKKEYNILLSEPQINVEYKRVDYEQIRVYMKSENYKIDYWKIRFNNFENTTTLDEYKLFISPYESGKLYVEGYIENKKVYEKSFEITAPLSEIKDYSIEIKDYIEIKLNLNNKIIDPIKYEIYKNGSFIETIENNVYRDKISYEEVMYEIIPIYPNGYKGEKIKIIKPQLKDIPDEINTNKLNLDFNYKRIIINGKEYLPENFKEGENTLEIILNDYTTWYKKIYLDSTPPKLEEYSLKYNGKYILELKTNEKSSFELFTKESTYVFDKPYIEFITFENNATLTIYDKLLNKSIHNIQLNPFPEYNITELKDSVSFEFEKDFPAEFCELRISDEKENIISQINVRNINNFSFSNFQPGKEYRFILYIDNNFQKEIYNKITAPTLPKIKKFENVDIGEFLLELYNNYDYNYYKIEIGDYTDEGVFEGNKRVFEIPLEKLTNSGTITIWREFKGYNTERISLKIKDNFLYNKKLYKTLPKTLTEKEYIISDDIVIEDIDAKYIVELYIFPGKKVIVNGEINASKIIFKSIKDYFQGIELKTQVLKNIEIYNANIGIYVNNNFDLYNLVIKNCNIGIYEKGFSGTAYNVLLYDNKKGIEMLDGDIEIKNSLFFDNETTFTFYNSNVYLYNLSIADSILDIEVYQSKLKIKNSSFLNSIESVNSTNSDLEISFVDFKNNKRTIKSIEDKLTINNSEFVNNEISLDLFKSSFVIDSSKFINNNKAIYTYNSNNENMYIKNSYFENNKIDVYIDGITDIYLENTEINNFFDGTVEPLWTNERGKVLNRGKIIMGGKK
ncbi:hypothetical protein [Marinitoga litoralis]|uniref:hypothetical protein n=1 Tax=Marinitoga litoralis TaxID=570855 RepID=UPI00195F8122|nr:hypothetical protein [Marinitoga litoralis]MBM7560294.1 hypothetical protein [Marinitoga litoralis]